MIEKIIESFLLFIGRRSRKIYSRWQREKEKFIRIRFCWKIFTKFLQKILEVAENLQILTENENKIWKICRKILKNFYVWWNNFWLKKSYSGKQRINYSRKNEFRKAGTFLYIFIHLGTSLYISMYYLYVALVTVLATV